MFRLENESPDDRWEAEALLDTAFGPSRFGLSAYRLRANVDPVKELSILVRDEFGSIAGLIRFWPIRVGDSGAPALLLGPIAVHPTNQGEGLGSLLITTGIERARNSNWGIVFLVGICRTIRGLDLIGAILLYFRRQRIPTGCCVWNWWTEK